MTVIRKIIFIFVLCVLFLPLIQSVTHLFKFVKPLNGVYDLTADTTFTSGGWFSGKYQTHTEKFLHDRFGLKSIFIRTHNQVDYSLFRMPHVGDLVIGKDNYLFIYWYFDTYRGIDFDGTRKLNAHLDSLKFIQDKLAQLHKTLLIVYAPDKDFFYPEYMPYKYAKNDSNNYNVSVKLAQEKGLNMIDFNKYFMEQKYKSKYPLYAKYDSHWSFYGGCLAGDSIISKLEALRNTKLARTTWRDTIISEEAKGNELELENEMNLIFPLRHDIMGHPRLSNHPDSSAKKLNVLVIGDSFFKSLNNSYNFEEDFSHYTYTYYYKTFVTSRYSKPIDIADFKVKDEINNNDIIIIEATTPNLVKLGWKFPEDAFKVLKKDSVNCN